MREITDFFDAELESAGLVTRAGLERARSLASQTGDRFVSVLINLGLVSDIDLAGLSARLLGVSLAGEADLPEQPVCPDALQGRYLRHAVALPLSQTDDVLRLAIADPLDASPAHAVSLATGRRVEVSVAPAGLVSAALDRLYPAHRAASAQAGGPATYQEEAERLRDMASEAPVVRLVNQLIVKAVETRATDIHIEPFEERLRIRLRYDGHLEEVDSQPMSAAAAITSRIKIMSKLDIAERRLPQDGRIRFSARGQEIDLRVSSIPSLHGETLALRILNRSGMTFDFDKLGLADQAQAGLRYGIGQPNGIVLVTGPTGSGKTTTLYATLIALNDPSRKIMTIEDPIEYRIQGVNQMQVKPQIGLTFASGLRHFLRQDPDVVLVGEIRDRETVDMAMQAALTGHLVLSTIHTNSAAGTIIRLRDMGVDDYLIASTLNVVVAQRLVRLLCAECKAPDPDGAAELARLERADGGRVASSSTRAAVFRPVGCPACRNTGYAGRVAVAETLVLNAALRQAITERAGRDALQAEARRQGMKTMFAAAADLVRAGRTTTKEVLRSIRDEDG